MRKLVELVGATTMAAVPIVERGEFLGLVTAGAEHDESQLSADGLLEAVRRPVVLEERILRVDASVGVASFPQDGDDYRTMLRRAGADMYRVKSQRRAISLAH